MEPAEEDSNSAIGDNGDITVGDNLIETLNSIKSHTLCTEDDSINPFTYSNENSESDEQLTDLSSS
jgi:hypothetical protein